MFLVKKTLPFDKMRATGTALAEVFEQIPLLLVSGVTTLALNNAIEELLLKNKLVSQSKGYSGYPHATCISLNNELVHGIPSSRVLHQGDLVKIDICAKRDGVCADMTRMFCIDAAPSKNMIRIINAAQEALDQGIAQCMPGKNIGHVSCAIGKTVELHGFGIVKAFAGHGIGFSMHQDPEILNYGTAGKGMKIKEGMALALEPMITEGSGEVYIIEDGWTAVSKEGGLAAHVEDTVIVTEHGPQVITRLQ